MPFFTFLQPVAQFFAGKLVQYAVTGLLALGLVSVVYFTVNHFFDELNAKQQLMLDLQASKLKASVAENEVYEQKQAAEFYRRQAELNKMLLEKSQKELEMTKTKIKKHDWEAVSRSHPEWVSKLAQKEAKRKGEIIEKLSNPHNISASD